MTTSIPTPPIESEVFHDWFRNGVLCVRFEEDVARAREQLKQASQEAQEIKHRFPDHQGVLKHKTKQVQAAQDQLSLLTNKLNESLANRDQLSAQLDLSVLFGQPDPAQGNKSSARSDKTNRVSAYDTISWNEQNLSKLEKKIEYLQRSNKLLEARLADAIGKAEKKVDNLNEKHMNLAKSTEDFKHLHSTEVVATVRRTLQEQGLEAMREHIQVQASALSRADNTWVTRTEFNNLNARLAGMYEQIDRFYALGKSLAERVGNTERQYEAMQGDLRRMSAEMAKMLANGPVNRDQFHQLQLTVRGNDHSIKALDSRYNALTTEYFYERIAAVVNPFEPKLAQLVSDVAKFQNGLTKMQSDIGNLSALSGQNAKISEKLSGLDENVESLRVEFEHFSTEQVRLGGALVEQSHVPKEVTDIKRTLDNLKTSFEARMIETEATRKASSELKDNVDSLKKSIQATEVASNEMKIEFLGRLEGLRQSASDSQDCRRKVQIQEERCAEIVTKLENFEARTATMEATAMTTKVEITQQLTEIQKSLQASKTLKTEPDCSTQPTEHRKEYPNTATSPELTYIVDIQPKNSDINEPSTAENGILACVSDVDLDNDTIVVAAQTPAPAKAGTADGENLLKLSLSQEYLRPWTSQTKSKPRFDDEDQVIIVDSDTGDESYTPRKLKRKSTNRESLSASPATTKRKKVTKR